MSKGPADPARGTQDEDAFVSSLDLARSASSFADVVEGEYGGEGCTSRNGKVSCGWEFHFCEEKGDVECECGSAASFQVQMFNHFALQIGKQRRDGHVTCPLLQADPDIKPDSQVKPEKVGG